ncbi:MAG TPA: hypothetical protein VFA45_00995 [Actinomycetes bacterium]|jgi:hypothetical protein|nr:hypothetical protein [Actinomycetes bacterium]
MIARVRVWRSIPDPLVDVLARRLRVVGEPTRTRVLDGLRHGPVSVQELVDAAGTSQPDVSKPPRAGRGRRGRPYAPGR